eukprot:scaffold25_cov65-Phaeocystis_antarctica.AAC.7
MPQAAQSFGQARPLSRLGRMNAGRPHQGRPWFPRGFVALCEDSYGRALGYVVHLTAGGRQPRRHDVGARQDEADRAAVHLELRKDVGVPAWG